MTIRIALNHKTSYHYDRPVALSPQIVRLRPAPHCRTPIPSYSLRVEPKSHFINWQQDPQGNYLARLVFSEPVRRFEVEVDLVAEMTVINPFDFFLEASADHFPFQYEPWLSGELAPYRAVGPAGPRLSAWLAAVDRSRRKTVDFLVELNHRLHQDIAYLIRLEPGVQTSEETLTRGAGSCRDSAWLLVEILRHLGIAARFVSGYLVQLTADVKSLDGPSGPEKDFTDLHAWAEAFLPGAGWVGLDPTSGLLCGEGHIPLACSPEPQSAAPISGSVGECETEFAFSMSVRRIHEDPRVTKPYNDEQWQRIEALGHEVDRRLKHGDVRLTMGGEPTFVSIDDMDGEEWKTAALGPTKRRLSEELLLKLKDRFSSGGLLHYGQGKWYPGEPLPRWALSCYWRTDGEPMWRQAALFADPVVPRGHTIRCAERFAAALARRLGVGADHVTLAYEDAWYYLWKERRLPINVDARTARLDDDEERARLSRIFERGVNAPVGCVLPLRRQGWQAGARWESSAWPVRAERMFLIPGDSPMGLRLPLDALPWSKPSPYPTASFPLDPLAPRAALPDYEQLREQHHMATEIARDRHRAMTRQRVLEHVSPGGEALGGAGPATAESLIAGPAESPESGNGFPAAGPSSNGPLPPDEVIRTALCVEPREGLLHVFMPPADRLEDYLDLVAAVEDTAEALDMPVVIEGYLPPHDHRLRHVKVTPDPGVIEVNVPPAASWGELTAITTGVYDDARHSRLGTEKFELDGTHSGTGGGNHVVLGGPTPAESPFLRRPDLLRSLLGYWHNHPALSYLFSGRFIGPTSQAPRVDEGRRDAIYELQIAFDQIPVGGDVPPWLVDRAFRHLLVDLTGNTHRSEFCIDKLYSPDTSSGRLGLVEFRAFEMPPHPRMSLTQQLLLRSLVARFWQRPYDTGLVDWGTSLHDRFMLPHFVWQDFQDVIDEARLHGTPLEAEWFAPHFEFRFPRVGEIAVRGLRLELRRAIEPWYVLGEEPAGGYTARYVDSSLERLQVKVAGMTDGRHAITCNGYRVPLHPTGTVGEFVAGVRFRAWQPPNCLHPTIGVDEPLVFDILDTWLERSVGGCRYHTGHPGGLNPDSFPVNALEAESRRGGRFFQNGHTPGRMMVPRNEPSPAFPLTLDLRREKGAKGRSWSVT